MLNFRRIAIVVATAAVCVLGLHVMAGAAAVMGTVSLLNAYPRKK